VACEKGHLEVVNTLLKYENIAVNVPDSEGKTPLFVACEKGHLEVVQRLLMLGADVTLASSSPGGRTVLDVALENLHGDVVQGLLQSRGVQCKVFYVYFFKKQLECVCTCTQNYIKSLNFLFFFNQYFISLNKNYV
jgi:ankyrin repeat protein